MASKWPTVRLGDQVTLQRGYDINRSQLVPGTVPVIASSGVIGFHNRAKGAGAGVLLGRKGTLGTVWFTAESYWPHSTALWARDFHGNDPRFVYYFFKGLPLQYLDVGTANPTLNRNHVHPLQVKWPPLDEQRRIASILGALDDKIELSRRMSRTLDAVAEAVFRSWFMGYGARGTIGPEDSLPLGWHRVRFSETIRVLAGGTPQTAVDEYWGGGIPWFSIADAPAESDVFVVSTAKTITQAGIDNSAAQLLPAGTTILTARGTVGRRVLVGMPMAMNQSCFGLQGVYDASGYYTYRAVGVLVAQLQRMAHGSVFNTINRSTLDSIEVVLPPVERIREYERAVSPLMDRIRLNGLESRSLVLLRDALLPRLLSGEIAVA